MRSTRGLTRTIFTALLNALLVWQLGCGPGGSSLHDTSSGAEVPPSPRIGVSREALVEPTRTARAIPGADETIPGVAYQSSVDGNGAARISVPIWTPPGRNGIEPHLSLEYSSRGGKGLAGVGFNLSGLSAITRCWKTPAVDGAYSAKEFEDEFCLDGERLIRQATAGEFRLENSGGTKIVSTGPNDEPSSFTVFRLDGTKAFYGIRDNASGAKVSVAPTMLTRGDRSTDLFVASAGPTRRTASWNVDRIEDRWGNFLEVDYQRTEDTTVVPNTVEVVPIEIRWTGWSGTPAVAPSRKVVFTYQTAIDVRRITTAQLRITHSKLLSKVQVWAENRWSNEASGTMSMFREYRFGYLTPAADTRTLDRLASITECYGEAPTTASGAPPTLTTCSDALSFSWKATAEPEIPSFSPSNQYPAGSYGTTLGVTAADIFDAVVGDFNGDGFDDYLYRRPKNRGGSVEFTNLGQSSLGTPIVSLTGEWLLANGSPTGLTTPILTNLPESLGGSFLLAPRVVDIDQDGRDDVIMVTAARPQYVPNGSTWQQDWSVLSLNDSSTGEFARRSPTPPLPPLGMQMSGASTDGYPQRSFNIVTGDFTGDGLTDILLDEGLGQSTSGMRIRSGVTSNDEFSLSPSTAVTFTPSATLGAGQETHASDIDGNGQVEFLARRDDGLGMADGLSSTLLAFRPGNGSHTETALASLWVMGSQALASIPGVGDCSGNTTFFQAFFVRYLVDVDGDGLPDSIALPSRARDDCGNVRNLSGLLLESQNIGGQFLPPVLTGGAPLAQPINSSQVPEVSNTVQTVYDSYVIAGREGQWRTVDNGLRFVDLNRDGRTDVVDLAWHRSLIGPSVLHQPERVFLGSLGGLRAPQALPLNIYDTGYSGAISAGMFGISPPDLSAGRGPRTARFGDFNGDGRPDIAFLDTRDLNGVFLSVSTQPSGEPDAIGSVSGGPLVVSSEFDYLYAGPGAPDVYMPATAGTCPVTQRCLAKAGWVVREHRTEANGFDSQVLKTRIQYKYRDARVDTRGRGALGFAVREWKDVTKTQDTFSGSTSVDLETTVPATPANGTPYTYVLNRTATTTAAALPATASHPATLAVIRTDSSARVVSTRSGGGFHTDSDSSESVTTEGGVESSRVVSSREYDEFGTAVTSTKTAGAAPASSTTTVRLTGTNVVDESNWLIARYGGVTVTATEPDPSQPGTALTTTRTTSLETYESSSPELKKWKVEPNGPAESPSSSGFTSETTVTRDAFGNPQSVTVTAGSQTRTQGLAYDSRDHMFPVQLTNALSQSERTFFDAALGLAVGSDDVRGQREATNYDVIGRPKTSRSGIRASDGVQYGDTVVFTYLQDKVQATRSRTETVCATNSLGARQCSQTDPLGRELVRSWTEYGNFQPQTDFTYDRFGNVVAETLPHRPSEAPVSVTRDFDLLGRPLWQERPGELATSPRRKMSWSYSARKVEHTSERGVVTRQTVDHAGRVSLRETVDPSATSHVVVLGYQYWPFGLLRKVVHPSLDMPMTPAPATTQLETVFSYDTLGRRTTTQDPDTGTESYLYDGFGQLKRVEDANQGVTTYEYDALGRPLRISTAATTNYPSRPQNGFAQNTTFEWDTASNGVGQLAYVTSNDGVRYEVSYDDKARPSSVSWLLRGQTYSFSYGYDSVSRVDQISYPPTPDGTTTQPFIVHYEYSQDGSVDSIFRRRYVLVQPQGPARPVDTLLWHQVSKNSAGQSTEEQFANSIRTTRAYDKSLELRLVESDDVRTGSPLHKLSYKWDADGFIKRKSDLSVGAIEDYQHDFLGRLADWKVTQNCETSEWKFHYDDWGNMRQRERISGPGSTIDFKYTAPGFLTQPHALKQRIEGGLTENYSHKAAGQVDSGRGNTFVWTPFGLPSKLSNASTASEYWYDGFGSRVLDIQTGSGGQWTQDVLSLGGLLETRTQAGSIQYTYNIPGPSGVVAQEVRTVTMSGLGPAQTRYFHRDHLGSAEVTTDGNGAVIDRAKYEPFGERRYPWAIGHPIVDSYSINPTQGFTGHVASDRFGLMNMRGRILDTGASQFLSADPILRPLSPSRLSRYSYASHSPATRSDPSGLDDVDHTGNTANSIDFDPITITGHIIKTGGIEGTPPPLPSYIGASDSNSSLTSAQLSLDLHNLLSLEILALPDSFWDNQPSGIFDEIARDPTFTIEQILAFDVRTSTPDMGRSHILFDWLQVQKERGDESRILELGEEIDLAGYLSMAFGGLSFGAGLLGSSATTTSLRSPYWAMKWSQRGRMFEALRNANIPVKNYPVVDDFTNGVVTSIKSLDLGAKSYQDASKLAYTLKKYVDTVAKFQGRRYGGYAISAREITGRALEVIVPLEGATAEQTFVLQSVAAYGERAGVMVRFLHY